MANPISSKDLFKGNVFSDQAKGAENLANSVRQLISALESLKDPIKESAKESKKFTDSINLKNIDTKKLIQLEKEYEKLKKGLSDTEKINKQLKKSQAELVEATDEQTKSEKDLLKEKLKQQKANRELKKQIEAEIILENKSIKNKEELRERIKALRIEGERLDLGSEELEANNAEIDRLTDLLKENSDQFIQNKINIGNYKSATEGLTNSFEDQQKRLKILTDAYKNAVAQGKKNTKETKEIKKALDDQKESLENVEKATKDTEKASKRLGTASKALGIGLIIAAVAKIGEFFGRSREASLESQKALANFTESLKVFFAALVNSFEGAKVIFSAFGESISSVFLSIEKAYLNVLLTLAEGKDFFSDQSEEIKSLNDQIGAIDKRQSELAKSSTTVAKGYEMIQEAFKGTTETASDAIDAQQEFLKLQLETEISIERQTRALAGLQEQRQILQDISDDDTLGFETRAVAVQKAQAAAIEFAEKEQELLKTREKLTIEAVKQDLRVSKVLSEDELLRITTGEQLNELIKDRGVALKLNSDNEAAFTEAFTNRIDKAVEVQAFQRDQEEKNRKTFRDSYEQRVDIIEEFSELQFARNEELLQSEEITQEKRLRLLADNEKISQDLIKRSTELTINQAKQSIDLNQRLTDSEKETANAKLDSLNISELVANQNQEEVFAKIRALDLGEIEEKRLKESIKIRREQIKANKESAKQVEETNKRNLELNQEVAAQEAFLNGEKINNEEELNKRLEELENERLENKKESLRQEIQLLPENSNLRLEKEAELNELLINEEKRRIAEEQKLRDEELAAEEKQAEQLKKIQEATFEFIEDLTSRQFEKRIEQINAEIEANKIKQDELRDLAALGSQNAEENLAFEKQRGRELELERQKNQEQQARTELFLALLKATSANIANGDEPQAAILKALSSGAVLQKAANVLPIPGFYEGTENLTKGDAVATRSKSKDPFLIWGHPGERIIDHKKNAELGNYSNEELVSIVKSFDKGMKLPHMTSVNNYSVSMPNELTEEIRALKSLFPRLASDLDKHTGIMTTAIRQGNKVTTNKRRTR